MPESPTIEFTPGIPLFVEIEFNQEDGTPLYLLDCDIKMQVKSSFGGNVLIELSRGNGKISVTGDGQNILNLSINEVETSSITTSGIFDIKIAFPDGRVEYYPNQRKERPGIFKLVPRVTI